MPVCALPQAPSAMVLTDREVLVALYNATGGARWHRKENWNTDAALSQWQGVKVNRQGRVVEVSLLTNNLTGTIPEEIGKLGALVTLELWGNKLSGHIPRQLEDLGALQTLDLSINKLEGTIPAALGALSKLTRLFLYGNELTGEIPASLGQLSNLQKLNLHSNKLSGAIPAQFGALDKLVQLNLSSNLLSGPIPSELGHLSALKGLYLYNNQLSGAIPKELGDLRAITHLDLSQNKLIDAPNRMLTGGSLARWQEKLRGARRKEPWAISVVEFLVSLWHFVLPIIDDVTDVILLSATFKDRGGLWWACCGAFVLADVERVLLFLVTLLLVFCWIPFALLGTNESRGKRFKVALKVLNGWHDLHLEPVFVRNDVRGFAVWGNLPSALRWPILDGFMWAVVGSRSKSSSLLSLCGMAGNTPVDVVEQSGFGLSLIDRIVHCHPYRILGSALFSCPHRHHLPGSNTTTRRSGVMLRAVGETLVVDSLFFALSLTTETWEDGVSIGVISLIFSVLELLTELQYYAAEARANMVTDGEEAMDTEVADRDSLELVDQAPSA